MAARCFLIVEDDNDIVVLEDFIIRTMGDETIVAPTVPIALTLIATEHIDGILLDLRIGDHNGQEILDYLVTDPRLSQIPVVVVTADSTGLRRTPQVQMVLRKPFAFPDFMGAVRSMVQIAGECKPQRALRYSG